jgi:hypothetical protein
MGLPDATREERFRNRPENLGSPWQTSRRAPSGPFQPDRRWRISQDRGYAAILRLDLSEDSSLSRAGDFRHGLLSKADAGCPTPRAPLLHPRAWPRGTGLTPLAPHRSGRSVLFLGFVPIADRRLVELDAIVRIVRPQILRGNAAGRHRGGLPVEGLELRAHKTILAGVG